MTGKTYFSKVFKMVVFEWNKIYLVDTDNQMRKNFGSKVKRCRVTEVINDPDEELNLDDEDNFAIEYVKAYNEAIEYIFTEWSEEPF